MYIEEQAKFEDKNYGKEVIHGIRELYLDIMKQKFSKIKYIFNIPIIGRRGYSVLFSTILKKISINEDTGVLTLSTGIKGEFLSKLIINDDVQAVKYLATDAKDSYGYEVSYFIEMAKSSEVIWISCYKEK